LIIIYFLFILNIGSGDDATNTLIPNTCVVGNSDYSSFNDDDYNIDVALNTKAVCMNIEDQPTPSPSEAEIVTFDANQNIVGCTIDEYNANPDAYKDVLSLSISECMTNVPSYDVTINSVVATSSSKNLRFLTDNNIMVFIKNYIIIYFNNIFS
jgi:hypothetical protein